MNYAKFDLCAIGMCGTQYHLSEDAKLIFKTKKENKVITFDPDFTGDYDEINYSYIEEKPDVKSYNSTQIIQGPYNKEWFELNGKKNRDMRNTRNKFDKFVEIREYQESDLEEILELIQSWYLVRYDVYGFNTHHSYDKAFFKTHYPKFKDKVKCLVFLIEGKIVGYSAWLKEPINGEFCYLIRKYLPEYSDKYRNLCVYIDFATYRYIFNEYKQSFTINLGASSKNLLKFKTMRFPVYELKKMYFYKIKRN